MGAGEWASVVGAILALVGGFAAMTRFLVKHYLSELRPNGGGSMRDSVNRLEERVDRIYEILCERQ